MENYLVFRILHGLATVLFFGGLAGLGWYGWRNFRSGDAALIGPSLRRILLAGVPLLILAAVSLPVSGWWMVNLAGLPLSQTWLLGGAILYLFGCIAWLLLFRRVARLREQALADGGPASAPVRRSLKFGAAYGMAGLLLFISVLAMMLAKPL
ncbi:DUF2269 domain-containing protein [Pseudomonas sp. DY-1]|uniref:DUF2269 domain-containing protein n=1 Tax=Pseudomonas sp. DY-1 TaxID=1755504 RepID=UPI000EA8A708|nr:DUF2269 domain-containing protein [Pseudomonas sp. DY-1]AYF89046.1 DUF2269 domain-containing protein [Pseudomonas sp. DY-1]